MYVFFLLAFSLSSNPDHIRIYLQVYDFFGIALPLHHIYASSVLMLASTLHLCLSSLMPYA